MADTQRVANMAANNVTVIVPTYNRADKLAKALDSVLTQTCPPLETFVIDDGSTDHTEALINRYYPTIHYLKQENRGVSTARNVGIQSANGEWLAFLDSDDEWRPNKLEMQMQRLKSEPDSLICHTEEIWVRNGRRVNPKKKHVKKGGWIFEHCLPMCAMSPSSIIIHRSVFEDVGLFDESLPACEDYDLWLRITAKYAVTFIDIPQIIKYGGHEDQLSQKYWGMDRFRIQALNKLLGCEQSKCHLSDHQRQAAAVMLTEKIKIFALGARKRGREEEATEYESLLVKMNPTNQMNIASHS